MNYIDLKYANLLSSKFSRYKVKATNPYRINFRCPLCGDSHVSEVKARGWLLETKEGGFRYYCHNCYGSHSFRNFLGIVDPLLHKDYITESYIENGKKNNKQPTKKEYKKPVGLTNEHLKALKKVSSLKSDHPVKEYIEKRKIPSKYHYKLFFAPKFKKWVNQVVPSKFESETPDEPRLIIPFFNKEKKMFGFCGRSFSKKSQAKYMTIMIDDEMPKLFGLDAVNFSKPYFVVEGPIDSFFLDNSIAMTGADGKTKGMEKLENAIFVFDNEKRNKNLHKMMEKVISNGLQVCVWPEHVKEKDINDMVLAGKNNIEKLILDNTYKGLEADLMLKKWKKTVDTPSRIM